MKKKRIYPNSRKFLVENFLAKHHKKLVLLIFFLSFISVFIFLVTISAQPEPSPLTVQQSSWVKTVKHSSIERFLFYNVTHERNGTELTIGMNVNTTVFNFLRDTYTGWSGFTGAEKLRRCRIIEPYVQEDFPSFSCNNPAHRQILLDRLQSYIQNGWELFQNGASRGFINATGNHLTITIPNIQNRDRVRLGQFTLIQEYQEINLINYKLDWAEVNVTLFINDSDGWNSTANSVWVEHRTAKEKFGANVSLNVTTYFKYEIKSDLEVKRRSNSVYYISNITRGRCGSVFCFNEESHDFSFSDICRRRINSTIVNTTTREINGTVLFDPQCSFSLQGERLDVEFYAEYNSSLGYILIDPTITITDVSTADSILTNITAENKFTHLTTGGVNIDFINDSNLLFYMPFDVNTSGTTYDYSKFNNDGAIRTNATFDSSGFIGGAFDFRGDEDFSAVQIADDPSLTISLNEPFTVSFWTKGNEVDNLGTFNPLVAKRDNSKGFFVIYLGGGIDEYRLNIRQQGQSPSNLNMVFTTQWLDGTWHHIVAGRNTTHLFGYVDGVFDGKLADTDMFDLGNGDTFCIGMGSVTSSDQAVPECEKTDNFTGTIDEVMFMNISLDSDQILDVYNNQSSRFLSRGEQIFTNLNVSGDPGDLCLGCNRINITVNITEFFNSTIRVSVGSVSGSGYSYGSEVNFSGNNHLVNLSLTTPNNISLKFIFFAGNGSQLNHFITPTLENDITIDSWEEITVAVSIDVNITQSFSILESPGREGGFERKNRVRALFNVLSKSLGDFFRDPFQQLTITPIVNRLGDFFRDTLQQLTITPLVDRFKGFLRDLPQQLTITPLVNRLTASFRIITQQFSIFPLTDRIGFFFSSISQSFSIDALVERTALRSIKIFQSFNIDAITTRLSLFLRVLISPIQFIIGLFTVGGEKVVIPEDGVGGGGGGFGRDPILDTIDPLLCQETLVYINVNGQSDFSKIDDFIENNTLEHNVTYKWTEVRRYLDRWQFFCSDLINRTLEEKLVCSRAAEFREINVLSNLTAINDLRKELDENVIISNQLLFLYINDFDNLCVGPIVITKIQKTTSIILIWIVALFLMILIVVQNRSKKRYILPMLEKLKKNQN